MATVFERVQKIIAEQLGVEDSEIKPETSFVDDLNADSLDLVELIMSLEEEFSEEGRTVEISVVAVSLNLRVQDAVSYIDKQGGSGS